MAQKHDFKSLFMQIQLWFLIPASLKVALVSSPENGLFLCLYL